MKDSLLLQATFFDAVRLSLIAAGSCLITELDGMNRPSAGGPNVVHAHKLNERQLLGSRILGGNVHYESEADINHPRCKCVLQRPTN